MAPQSLAYHVKKPKAKWSMTVMMNARDLSRDDDFLSHLLVEHLGTDDSPLQVHKMDPSRRLPKHEPDEVLAIVKKYVVRRGGSSTSAHRVKRAVDALLELSAVKQYLHKRSTAQINAFATHASRYFELYLPTGSIEISHTSRYSHRTGKSELCILATLPLKVGQVISDLKGSLAHLTVEEDEELKKTDSRRRDGGIRRDFSVIHSNQKNKSHLFLGPARFVNHDCDHNVELFRDGRVITFRVIKPIATGQEVTAHYGEGYFGKGNRHCLCQTCERLGRGGYTPIEADSDREVEDDSSTDEETREERIKAGLGLTAKGNPNERRTRRGVYAILPEEDTDDEDRVGAIEAVVAQIPVQLVNSTGNNGERGYSAAAMGMPSTSATPDSSDSSTLIPPSVSSGNSPQDLQDRQLSDTSSALTPLSDSDKMTGTTESTTDISVPQPLTPLSSLSSLSSASSAPCPKDHVSVEVSPVDTPTTPVISRISTRSSTASQNKGKSKDENPSVRVNEEISSVGGTITARRKIPLRSVGLAEPAEDTEQPQSSLLNEVLPLRLGRRSRNSLPAASATPSIPDSNLSYARRSSSSHVTKNSQSKSATPSSGIVSMGAQAAHKSHSTSPRCSTCATELPHLRGVKTPRHAVLSCIRCKRHFAIFAAPWPNRTASLEALSSSSSDSSSNETVVEVTRENAKDVFFGQKHSKKHVDVKHLLERPFKRRKTDSALYATGGKIAYHHAEYQPRNSNGQFGNSAKKVKKSSVYSPQKFTIPGGAQRARAHRALNRESAKGLSATTPSLGTKRKWDGTEKDLLQIRSRKRPWGDDDNIPGSRTIRHVGSLPVLTAAKSLAALCARPSPNLFARNAWAASVSNAGEQADEDYAMETSSELTELPETETKSAPAPAAKPPPPPPPPPQTGQKRKREPISTERKPKVGKTFYMKDEKKPMPKGWVLVTDSSEETGEEEEEEGAPLAPQAGTSGEPQPGTNLRTDYTPVDLESASGSTPSLAHTPSSRATSTPTQSSGTLVDDHRIGTSILTNPAATVTYSLRRSTISRTPSTVVQSSKRRKHSLKPEEASSPSQSGPTEALQRPSEDGSKSLTDQRTIAQEDSSGLGDTVPDPRTTIPENNCSKVDITERNASATPENLSAPSESPEFIAKAEPVSFTIMDSENSFPSLLEKYNELPMPVVMELPDTETKRTALDVSNIIHGTAFSYGHPDARSTWKPKYHYSELDGWDC